MTRKKKYFPFTFKMIRLNNLSLIIKDSGNETS